ncbi:hypothetical protein NDU88_003382 [Pleurodeles waltl]|uniref:Uncharacterized protein n=1 Tax=Pleurodeles waltl TaxID=8319 RepID=A0AAV7UD58_PLEWA|nr:hypothetical protein NDU88_003382 [Pleurodeles waltl]
MPLREEHPEVRRRKPCRLPDGMFFPVANVEATWMGRVGERRPLQLGNPMVLQRSGEFHKGPRSGGYCPYAVDSKDCPMTDPCEGRQRANRCPLLCHSGPRLGKCSLKTPDQPTQGHCVDGHPGRPASESLHARKGAQPIQALPRGCTAEEATYHLFWERAYAQDLLKALSTELGAWIPTTCITADSVMYGLFPGSHALGDLQGCWRLLYCFKDVLLFSRNRLVVGKKETSTLGCRKMIQGLLHDYAALDGSDSDDET